MNISYSSYYKLLFGTLLLSGCVPANQTTAVLNDQTNDARNQHSVEMSNQSHLIRDRRKLESELASNRARIRELKTTDPQAGNSSVQQEIGRLERQNSLISRQIASAF